jgi:hypothetical protein
VPQEKRIQSILRISILGLLGRIKGLSPEDRLWRRGERFACLGQRPGVARLRAADSSFIRRGWLQKTAESHQ